MIYKAVSCTPCDKSLWKLLKAIENGFLSSLKAENPMFDHIRAYISEADVPCCRIEP